MPPFPKTDTVKHHLANARSKVGAETTAQLVWILAPRLPEPEGTARADESRQGYCGVLATAASTARPPRQPAAIEIRTKGLPHSGPAMVH